MDKYPNERVKAALKVYLKKINKKFKLQKAILFGSRARDDYLLDSDVDLILVSPDFKQKGFRARMGEVLADWSEGIDLEALCYTPDEFDVMKKRIGIVRQAVKEGKELRFN